MFQVKWARENYHHDTGSPYSLRLASGDTNGSVIIWDVSQGEAKTEFSDGNKPIQGVYSRVIVSYTIWREKPFNPLPDDKF